MIFAARARTVAKVDNNSFARVDGQVIQSTIFSKTIQQCLEIHAALGNQGSIICKLQHSQNFSTHFGTQRPAFIQELGQIVNKKQK
jgi:hypothetical protein